MESLEEEEAFDPDDDATNSTPKEDARNVHQGGKNSQSQLQSIEHHPDRMCSVLNVVIDHSMEDITPMEVEEWQQQKQNCHSKSNLKVPVLRVFGPLIRNNPPFPHPVQSACLYIRNAFPYMLARPRICGPDGSLLRATSSTNIDWDNPEEIERIQKDIQIILENTLQSMDLKFGERKEDIDAIQPPPLPKQQRMGSNQLVIRKVTVVEGRGFYTFCPGPTAPFLRIEYYNPKLRWKIKLVLEKGLEVPQRFHPDPRQYDRVPSDSSGDEEEDALREEEDFLRFHCYEAHIPYTMQFFKDHNLAGMSYIHIHKGRIRDNLSTSVSLKTKQLHVGGDQQQETIRRCAFLKSNTPDSWRWPQGRSQQATDANLMPPPLPLQQFSQDSNTGSTISRSHNRGTEEREQLTLEHVMNNLSSCPEYVPPAKGTSCDIEIDCTVDDILNVENILTHLPSDQEERDKIQWRAVPSLQEIWKEERARMTRLLSPKVTQEVIQDVLSQRPSPSKASSAVALPLTLNVKEGAARSGARLAAKGMWSLVDVTEGLRGDFLRCLSDILERHRKAIELVDKQLQENAEEDASKDSSDVLTGVRPWRFHFSPLTPRKMNESKEAETTPSMIQALDALESLGAFTPGSQVDVGERNNLPSSSPRLDDTIDLLDSIATATPGSQDDTQKHSTVCNQEDSPSETIRLMNNVSSPQVIDENESIQLPFARSQQPESNKGKLVAEPVALKHNSVEISRILNHDGTLGRAPIPSMEEFIDPETLAPYDDIELDLEHCRAVFLVDTDPSNVTRVCGFQSRFCSREGHRNSERRAKPGLYKTVITGTVVDGMHNISSPNRDEEESEDDAEALELFCQQSQKHIEELTKPTNTQVPSRKRRVHFHGVLSTQLENEEEEIAEVLSSDDESHSEIVFSKGTSFSSCKDRTTEETSRFVLDAPSKGGMSRPDVNSRLHPINRNAAALQQWLHQACEYEKRKRMKATSQEFPILNPRSSYIQPVIIAPTRAVVEAWSKKRRKEKSRPNEARKRQKSWRHDALKIDSNTRKLVAQTESMTEYGGNFSQGIEEATWELSQRVQMTPTQGSQQENESTKKQRHLFPTSDSQDASVDALLGIGAQGGRIHIEGGGGLKAKTRVTQPDIHNSQLTITHENQRSTSFSAPVSAMSIEVHVQCREGTSRLDSKKISMALDSNKDKIVAIVYCFARDPGGGNSIELLQRGCICSSLEGENPEKDAERNHKIQVQLLRSMPRSSMGFVAPLLVEVVRDERHILRRFKDIVRMKDPDMMLSWDTQGAGIGYIIERGLVLGKSHNLMNESKSKREEGIDMVKLLGRTPVDKKASLLSSSNTEITGEEPMFSIEGNEKNFQGSGLGSDWDDRVGAGAAAASIVGRLVFAGWKIVAEEVKHGNASYLPAVVAAVLNKRIPHHDDMTLAKWFASERERWRVLNYRLTQATATLLLFDALDIIGRAGEAARLSGVEFSQSFPGIRGSQYKVEGVLLRALQSLRSDERGSKRGKQAREGIGHSQFSSVSEESKSQTQSPWKVRRRQMERRSMGTNSLEDRQYFFFSPSLDDTNKQEALEVQALTLEPVSGHYTEPVLVCDFTALYPSLVIAYNLCYSTCAGKLEYHTTRREMRMEGRTRGRIGPITYPERRTATILKHHFKCISDPKKDSADQASKEDFSRDRAYIAPSGTIYLSETILKGVLPQVLDEILTTRAMLKRAAKEYKKGVKNLSPAILRQLEARQLALKYVANVTYGYTSATFSGRCAMPLLADSIVECGRRTLRKAMHIANEWGQGKDPWGNTDRNWLGATVIYGDTDSLFIKMPGRTHKEAFQFGEIFCNAVTSLNPPPVQLKLEKVYLGSIMQTMKRYGGMKFESKDQKKPTFEAKGLEIVRRDQCSLTQKILRNALITLFRHGINAVREYLNRQWSIIIAGKLPVSDFVLTGRVRSKYRGGREGPVQAVLARRLGEADPGRIVRHKERLPYVIVATPGVTFRLKDCVLTPLELLERWDAYKIHSGYYIERHVNAALQRCLGLAPHFVKIQDWYQACPKPRRRTHFWPIKSKRAMITAYFGNDICSLCGSKCQADGSNLVVVCNDCRSNKARSIQEAASLVNAVEKEANAVANECSKCNSCYESAHTFAVVQESEEEQGTTKTANGFFGKERRSKPRQSLLLPLANCVCIDCPKTFRRHRLRERGIEADSTYETLTR